jgi:hypothetical protein
MIGHSNRVPKTSLIKSLIRGYICGSFIFQKYGFLHEILTISLPWLSVETIKRQERPGLFSKMKLGNYGK